MQTLWKWSEGSDVQAYLRQVLFERASGARWALNFTRGLRDRGGNSRRPAAALNPDQAY